MPDPKVNVTLTLTDKLSAGMQEAQKNTKGMFGSLTELASGLSLARTGIDAVSNTARKLYELGKQGAVVEQTAESFDTLLKTVGANRDLLEELRTTSRGTIDDLTLMKGTATLLAGASDELARDLAANSPQLLEIAKAAQKLNPQLGDTAFLYDSIATGIKRASPLILDNLGITVKIGEANEKYAEQLGKAVTELTAEEQKVALLNATLEAGDTLIAQVGGTTESATDAFSKFETSITNARNELSTLATPTTSDVVDGLSDVIDATVRAITTFDELDNQTTRLTQNTLFKYIPAVGNLIEGWDLATKAARQYLDETDEQIATGEMLNRISDEGRQLAVERARASDGIVESIMSEDFNLREVAKAQAIYSDKLREYIPLANKVKAVTDSLAAGLRGDLLDAMDDYDTTMAEINSEQTEITDQLEEMLANGIKPTSDEVLELQGRFAELNGEMLDAADALEKATAQMIYQQAAAGLDAGAALDLARNLGLLSEQDYAVAKSVQDLRLEFDKNADGMIDASEKAFEFAGQVDTIYDAIRRLQDQDLPLTMESIQEEVDKINLEEIVESAKNAGQPLDDLAKNVEAVGQNAEESIDLIQGVIDTAKESAGEAQTPVDDLSLSIDGLRTDTDLATIAVNDLREALATLPDQKIIDLIFRTSTTGSGVPTGPGGQHGLHMVVPPGFPDDSFPLRASSGEEVLILPPGQKSGAGQGGGNTYVTNNVTQNFNDEGAAALGLAAFRQGSRDRLNASMGR